MLALRQETKNVLNPIKPASERSTDRWENEGGPTPSAEMQSRDDLQSELQRYGITPVQLTVFDWGGYRYSNSSDAIAAAKRLAASEER